MFLVLKWATHPCSTFTNSHTSAYLSAFRQHVFLLVFHPSASQPASCCLVVNWPNTFSMLCDHVTTSGQGHSLLLYQHKGSEAAILNCFYYCMYVELWPDFITCFFLWFFFFLSHHKTVTLLLKQHCDQLNINHVEFFFLFQCNYFHFVRLLLFFLPLLLRLTSTQNLWVFEVRRSQWHFQPPDQPCPWDGS